MGRVGTRRTVERGIYRDAIGFEVVARAGKLSHGKRYPLDTALKDMRAWRDATASDLRDERQPTTDTRTVAGAVRAFKKIAAFDAGESPALSAWVQEYGSLERRKLTDAKALQAFEKWRGLGYSGQSLYYRKLVIQKVWRTLDGPKTRTPVDDIAVTRTRSRRPVWVSDETILQVLLQLTRHEMLGLLRNAKTRARFLVLVTTGQRPAQLKRTRRGDVEFWRAPQDGIYGVWWVRAAKGGEPTPVYLNREMRQAWEAFIVSDAWGDYSTRSFARTLHGCGWPKGVRPYNARHATGLTLSERGIDLSDISAHMGHTDLKTTRSFYVPNLHSRSKHVSRILEGRFSTSVAPKRGTS